MLTIMSPHFLKAAEQAFYNNCEECDVMLWDRYWSLLIPDTIKSVIVSAGERQAGSLMQMRLPGRHAMF